MALSHPPSPFRFKLVPSTSCWEGAPITLNHCCTSKWTFVMVGVTMILQFEGHEGRTRWHFLIDRQGAMGIDAFVAVVKFKKWRREHLHLQAPAIHSDDYRLIIQTYASGHSHMHLTTHTHTHTPRDNLLTQFVDFCLCFVTVLLSSFPYYLLPQQQHRIGCVWVFCPAFSQCNKPLIIESTQACQTPLLLTPSSQLPATSHWGVYTLTHTDTHTHMQIHSCRHKCKQGA